jgi:hypothetical protein
MDAKEFLKTLELAKNWSGEDEEYGQWLYYEKGVIEAMEQYHQSKVNNGVLDDVSVLLPKLKECQDARKDFINKKAQSGYSTLLKGVGDHFQAGVNWALNYISNKR